MVKRTALGGSGSGDKQRGTSGRRRRREKWRRELGGDEFGQEEMSRGETGIKKERGGEKREGEMDGKRV